MAGSEAVDFPVQTYSTRQLQPRQQFDCFCDAIATTFAGIQPQRLSPTTFDADYRAVQLADVALARLDAPAHRAKRGATELATRPDDSLFLNVSPYLPYRAQFESTTVGAAAGQPLLLDNSQMFQLSFEGAPRMRLYSLRLSRDQLGVPVTPALVAGLNRSFRTDPRGRLASQQLKLLVEASDLADGAVAHRMCGVLLPLMQQLALQTEQSGALTVQLAHIKAVAAGFLSDPAFALPQLAQHFGSTPRTLQKRFAEAGETFAIWLMAERLERVRQQLADPALSLVSTEQLAYRCGFRDASHFRHRFKARFGVAPQAYRRAQLAAPGGITPETD
ncbi:helix-turn-helix transcriptional regulator [Saccharospirillum mangrovi]|uniref:helix-turn-helix transcriptional regulator n=1 Tax=Saccharospirillum mangrovi TaxID=2161747 RepID=UPI000D34F646|nr:AraC family transcriptional regulator [Saccharospirillum mangrovi]